MANLSQYARRAAIKAGVTTRDFQIAEQTIRAATLRQQGGLSRGVEGTYGGDLVRQQINIHVNDYGLRARMSIAPAKIAKDWKTDMSHMAKRIFEAPIRRRIPVRRVAVGDFYRSGKSRPGLKSGARGKAIKAKFRAHATLEHMELRLGGKYSPFLAILELGAKPHSTYWKFRTRSHLGGDRPWQQEKIGKGMTQGVLALYPKRVAGGGAQGGFPGFHFFERGVASAFPRWIHEYKKYNDNFVEWLALGQYGKAGTAVANQPSIYFWMDRRHRLGRSSVRRG